jgi:hypothetical protein
MCIVYNSFNSNNASNQQQCLGLWELRAEDQALKVAYYIIYKQIYFNLNSIHIEICNCKTVVLEVCEM